MLIKALCFSFLHSPQTGYRKPNTRKKASRRNNLMSVVSCLIQLPFFLISFHMIETRSIVTLIQRRNKGRSYKYQMFADLSQEDKSELAVSLDNDLSWVWIFECSMEQDCLSKNIKNFGLLLNKLKNPALFDLLFFIAIYSPKNDNKRPS